MPTLTGDQGLDSFGFTIPGGVIGSTQDSGSCCGGSNPPREVTLMMASNFSAVVQIGYCSVSSRINYG